MFFCLIRTHARVYASDDNLYPSCPEFCGDLIGPRCKVCHDRDAHKIDIYVKIDIFYNLINDLHLYVGWSMCRNGWQAELWKPEGFYILLGVGKNRLLVFR